MSWHFQVVRDKQGILSLHEVFLNEKGEIYAWVAEPERIANFETMTDLRKTLEYMLRDSKRPVVDEADLPRGEVDVDAESGSR